MAQTQNGKVTRAYISRERVSLSARDKLFAEITNPDSVLASSPIEERLRFVKQYERYKQCRALPYYDELYHILSHTGLDYKKFFQIIGTPVVWGDNIVESFAKRIEQIEDRAFLIQLSARIQAMLPEVWSFDGWGDTPSYRLQMWKGYVISRNKALELRKQYKPKDPLFFERRVPAARLQTENLIEFGNAYGVPLHWLLCAPEEATLMMSDPLQEEIVVRYSAASSEARRIADYMVDLYNEPVSTGKGGEC